jgi:NAD(P)-dependent dehydrogenase (short-subunit alcohol dehydrogenase family)
MAATLPIAIIAGVGPGTGAALARKFGAAYPVALLSRSPDNVSSLVREINERGGRAVGVRADVSDQESMKAAIEQVRKEFGDNVTAAVRLLPPHPPLFIKMVQVTNHGTGRAGGDI